VVSCPWGELSMGRAVHGASCPWGELTMGRAVHGASCPRGELSIGRAVMERVSMDGWMPSWTEVISWSW
jgi:hypothetical protein